MSDRGEDEGLLFEGLKVLDVGTWVASPAAATILADFGADVIKVEVPKGGDPYRVVSSLPIFPKSDVNFGWLFGGRNKRSLTLNLKTPEGREVLHRLVAECDVYLTNHPLPMRRALGLGYEDLSPLNPRMIYASITAYGEQGPDADLEAFDTVAWWARSGLMDIVRGHGAAPASTIAHAMGDHPTAVSLYAAIVTALLRRERTGKGGLVHTSLLANGLWSNAILAQAAMVGARFNHERPAVPPPNDLLFETSDGRHVKPFMLRNKAEFDRLLRAAGLEWTIADPRFAEPEARAAHMAELLELLRQAFAQRPAGEWVAAFRAAEAPLVMVRRTDELPDDPQILLNNMVVAPADPAVPAPLVVNHPLGIEGLPRTGVRAAPELGQHNAEILAALGYSPEEMDALSARGAI